MRALILGFAVGLTFAASAQAAPLSPNPAAIEVGAASSVQLVAGSCGWGWHRRHWQDRWGNWHWGHCVPANGPYVGWGAGRYYPYTYWHGADPARGWGYQ
jgi:hypothetical protein